MPKYTYTCNSCGEQVKIFHEIGENPNCSMCGSGELEKVLLMPSAGHKKQYRIRKKAVGELTTEFIEGVKKDLKEQKSTRIDFEV